MRIKRKKPYQSTQKLLPIKAIISGVVVTDDNRYIKILEILPINYLSKTEAEQNRIISSFERLLKIAPDNMQIKITCQKADISRQMEKIQQLMRQENNARCHEMLKEYAELLKTVVDNDSISRRFFLAFEYPGARSGFREQSIEGIIQWCNTVTERIRRFFADCGNEVITVEPDSFNSQAAENLYSFLNPKKAESVEFSENAAVILERYHDATSFEEDPYIPAAEFFAPQSIDFTHPGMVLTDGKYCRYGIITSDGYPERAVAGWPYLLVNAFSGINMDIYLKRVSFEEINGKIKRSIARNSSSYSSLGDLSDGLEQVKDSISGSMYLRKGLQQGLDFYYMSFMLTVMAESREELDWKYEEYRRFLSSNDIHIRECLFEQEEAFISSLPLCRLSQSLWSKSQRNILSHDLSSIYPFSSYELIDDDGIYLGKNISNGSLVIIDVFNTKKYNNANIFISGSTGSGKTYALLLIAMRMRLQGIPVFILAPEKEHEFLRVCRALSGQFIRLAAGSPHRINLLEISRKAEMAESVLDDGVSRSFMLEKVSDLKTFFSLLIPDLSYEEKQLIDECLIDVYADFSITQDNNSLVDPLTGKYRKMPIFSDFFEKMKKREKLERVRNICRELVSGSAQFFNGQTNVDLNNDFTVIGLEGLPEETLPIGMFSAINFIWEKIRSDRTSRKAVFIDEYWRFAFNQVAANYTLKISKTIRAYGGSLILSTQQMTDIYGIENGKYGEGVLNNCRLKIVLKVESRDADSIRDILHLTESERMKLTNYHQGEGMLIIGGNNIDIRFTASQTEHQLITTDREDLRRIVEEAVRKRGEGKKGSVKEVRYLDVIESNEITRLEKTKRK